MAVSRRRRLKVEVAVQQSWIFWNALASAEEKPRLPLAAIKRNAGAAQKVEHSRICVVAGKHGRCELALC